MPNAILVDNSPRSTSFRPKPLPLPNPTAKDVSADHPVNVDPSQFYAKFHAGKDSAVLHPDNYALFGLSAASHQDVISNNNKRKAWFAFKIERIRCNPTDDGVIFNHATYDKATGYITLHGCQRHSRNSDQKNCPFNHVQLRQIEDGPDGKDSALEGYGGPFIVSKVQRKCFIGDPLQTETTAYEGRINEWLSATEQGEKLAEEGGAKADLTVDAETGRAIPKAITAEEAGAKDDETKSPGESRHWARTRPTDCSPINPPIDDDGFIPTSLNSEEEAQITAAAKQPVQPVVTSKPKASSREKELERENAILLDRVTGLEKELAVKTQENIDMADEMAKGTDTTEGAVAPLYMEMAVRAQNLAAQLEFYGYRPDPTEDWRSKVAPGSAISPSEAAKKPQTRSVTAAAPGRASNRDSKGKGKAPATGNDDDSSDDDHNGTSGLPLTEYGSMIGHSYMQSTLKRPAGRRAGPSKAGDRKRK